MIVIKLNSEKKNVKDTCTLRGYISSRRIAKKFVNYYRVFFLISQPKYMMWVLKRTASKDGSFEHPKRILKLMRKNTCTILSSKIVFI